MTQVSWTRNLILAVSLCALGTLAYWLEYKHKPEKETAQENSKKIFSLKDVQIESIRLSDDGKTFQWECQDLQAKTCKAGDNSKWRLTEPTQVRADDSNVNSLVSALNNLNPAEIVDLKDETPEKRAALMKEYGLEPEALQGPAVKRVDVKTSAGETVIYLGGTNPINENIFAVVEKVSAGQKPAGKPDDSKVYQIPGYFKTQFSHDLTYWRDKKVLAFVPSEVESFEIKSKKNGVITARRKDGNWILKSGSNEVDGDIENVEAFLSGAAFMTAKNFAADSKADAKAKATLKGLPEILSVTFQKNAGAAKETPAPVVLLVYGKNVDAKAAPKPKAHDHSHELDQGASAEAAPVYATVSNNDPLYEIQRASLNQLDKSLKDLRLNKLITSLDRFSTQRLEFSGKPMGNQPLTLIHKENKWVNAADQSEVNGEKVQSVLDRISGNRIRDFLMSTAVPAGEKEGLFVTLGDDKNPAKRKLVFWKSQNQLYARDLTSTRQEAFLVDSMVTDGLPWERNFFKK